MAIKAYSYVKDGSKALSKNFHVREFQCKDRQRKQKVQVQNRKRRRRH